MFGGAPLGAIPLGAAELSFTASATASLVGVSASAFLGSVQPQTPDIASLIGVSAVADLGVLYALPADMVFDPRFLVRTMAGRTTLRSTGRDWRVR